MYRIVYNKHYKSQPKYSLPYRYYTKDDKCLYSMFKNECEIRNKVELYFTN